MNINSTILTLEEFRKQELRSLPSATGELSNLLRDISLAAKRVNVEVNKAGLVDILGITGDVNIQGETVQKLDVFANNQFIAVLNRSMSCAGIASEEEENFISFEEEHSNQSKYVVVMDPLDGSSNIDVNISIGTIFGVFKRLSSVGSPCILEDFLQPGSKMIAAGYIIYGSSTMLVYATRRGVNGFTLDPSIGEFMLSHPDIQCPANGKIYSVNYGNIDEFSISIQNFIRTFQRDCELRYTGSLVADMHRNLLKGGIFIYPASKKYHNGKLRLVYECNPFAFILEIAGGISSDAIKPILHIHPRYLHERTPFFSGSLNMMPACEAFLNGN